MTNIEATARRIRRSMNGYSNKALAAPIAALIAPPPSKEPKSWSTALELCREAAGWTHKALILNVFPNERSVTVNDVKRWESARSVPAIAQCQKLRMKLPRILDYDYLLPLDRRGLSHEVKPPPPRPVSPEGWPGPPVSRFGEALRWCRIDAGMSQVDLGRIVGVTQAPVAVWERETRRMIKQTYRALCDVFPALQFAPLPEFSAKYQNTPKKRGFLDAEASRMEAARSQHALDEADQEMGRAAKAPAPIARMADPAMLNQLGAAYGVARAALKSIRAEEVRLKQRHDEEQLQMVQRHEEEVHVLEQKIADAEKLVADAEALLDQEAHDMHGGGAP